MLTRRNGGANPLYSKEEHISLVLLHAFSLHGHSLLLNGIVTDNACNKYLRHEIRGLTLSEILKPDVRDFDLIYERCKKERVFPRRTSPSF